MDEASNKNDIDKILHTFAKTLTDVKDYKPVSNLLDGNTGKFQESLKRKSKFMQHSIFHKYHCETEMMRYIARLERHRTSL